MTDNREKNVQGLLYVFTTLDWYNLCQMLMIYSWVWYNPHWTFQNLRNKSSAILYCSPSLFIDIKDTTNLIFHYKIYQWISDVLAIVSLDRLCQPKGEPVHSFLCYFMVILISFWQGRNNSNLFTNNYSIQITWFITSVNTVAEVIINLLEVNDFQSIKACENVWRLIQWSFCTWKY